MSVGEVATEVFRRHTLRLFLRPCTAIDRSSLPCLMIHSLTFDESWLRFCKVWASSHSRNQMISCGISTSLQGPFFMLSLTHSSDARTFRACGLSFELYGSSHTVTLHLVFWFHSKKVIRNKIYWPKREKNSKNGLKGIDEKAQEISSNLALKITQGLGHTPLLHLQKQALARQDWVYTGKSIPRLCIPTKPSHCQELGLAKRGRKRLFAEMYIQIANRRILWGPDHEHVWYKKFLPSTFLDKSEIKIQLCLANRRQTFIQPFT